MIVTALATGGVLLIALLVFLRVGTSGLETRYEKVFALAVMGVLPILWMGGAFLHADYAMKKVTFCTRCHEMAKYGESLRADDEGILSATHFQNSRVDRTKACYVCHTSEGVSGIVEAKMRGLRHVIGHYLGDHSGDLHLYEPYKNDDCLRCHGEARNFLEGMAHRGFLEELQSGEVSCLECHDVVHFYGGEE